ncbi:hypothetical protein IP88_05855 [alpha proteobacterium AAP81b]|nr:hypothetical protein IP88_05855 [alpha proteobacterium AAP81b]
MTVNERLFALGQLDAFDAAVATRDLARLSAILRKAEVDDEAIAKIAIALGFDLSGAPAHLAAE